VAEMDKVVQQNASGAKASASASEGMTALADTMKTNISELVDLMHGRGSNKR